eukprot:554024-Pelagomonas_calceolata.AAC.2
MPSCASAMGSSATHCANRHDSCSAGGRVPAATNAARAHAGGSRGGGKSRGGCRGSHHTQLPPHPLHPHPQPLHERGLQQRPPQLLVLCCCLAACIATACVHPAAGAARWHDLVGARGHIVLVWAGAQGMEGMHGAGCYHSARCGEGAGVVGASHGERAQCGGQQAGAVEPSRAASLHPIHGWEESAKDSIQEACVHPYTVLHWGRMLKEKKNYEGRRNSTSTTSTKEKEIHRHKRAARPLHHKDAGIASCALRVQAQNSSSNHSGSIAHLAEAHHQAVELELYTRTATRCRTAAVPHTGDAAWHATAAQVSTSVAAAGARAAAAAAPVAAHDKGGAAPVLPRLHTGPCVLRSGGLYGAVAAGAGVGLWSTAAPPAA